jgi:predicted transcriptional regulator
MRNETVQYFSKKEESIAHLLIELGIHRNVAWVLVFFARTPDATSHDIEHGTGLRQPEISLAVKQMTDRGWIVCCGPQAGQTGRKKKVYELAKTLTAIVDSIEIEKKQEAEKRLARLKKLQTYLP